MILLPGNRLLSVGIGYSDTTVVLERYDLSQRLYAEQDANYNVTSLTDSNGNVVERYSYPSYGTVTVLNADGTTEGDGTITSSSVGWVYTFQGLRVDPVTGLLHADERDLEQLPILKLSASHNVLIASSNMEVQWHLKQRSLVAGSSRLIKLARAPRKSRRSLVAANRQCARVRQNYRERGTPLIRLLHLRGRKGKLTDELKTHLSEFVKNRPDATSG